MLYWNNRQEFYSHQKPVFRIRIYVFWASWICIRIHNLFILIRIRILPSTSKKMKKSLDFYCFLALYFLSLKNDVNVPSKRNKHKNLKKKDYFLSASWSLKKRAGSGAGSASGSVSQSYRSEDLHQHSDPYQNVTDPEHWQKHSLFLYYRISIV